MITSILLWTGCCAWGCLTGIFFALPTLSPWLGSAGIGLALIYCGAVCLWGKGAMSVAMGLTIAATFAYVIVTRTDFSVVNYGVAMVIIFNLLLFGYAGASLIAFLPPWSSWLILAGVFGGSLGLGWILGLIFG